MPDPTPEPATPATPDALMIPDRFKVGDTLRARVDSICTLAEGILKGDRSKGITARCRPQPGGKSFVTLDWRDEIRFSPKTGKSGPRYHWVTQPNGIEYGYLVDAAKETSSA